MIVRPLPEMRTQEEAASKTACDACGQSLGPEDGQGRWYGALHLLLCEDCDATAVRSAFRAANPILCAKHPAWTGVEAYSAWKHTAWGVTGRPDGRRVRR
jgi:hypothetical protein